ncbi:hypothetical protein DMH27_13240 [Raoultella planticola]|nr:hypothetical protein [Raoultella planticola]
MADALKAIPNPLINQAITINILSGITGSSSGGMSIALAAMADRFIEAAHAAGIPLEVMHRVASMAAGNGYAAAQRGDHHAAGGDGVNSSSGL